MAQTCCCTNQCKACGQCCQVDCGHRKAAFGTYTTPITSNPYVPAPKPEPVPFQRFQPGAIKLITHEPLTAEQIREIVREEIGKGLETALAEIRDLKGDGDA